MADVGRSPEEGQIMLVSALGLAVLFVTLALTLNTVIYTENLATRGNDLPGGQNALGYSDTAQEGVSELVEHTNYEHNTTYTDLESNLSQGVEDWNEQSSTHSASSATVSNTSLVSSNRGTRIVQDTDRNFTDDDANVTWTLSEDVSGTREFTMNVSGDRLVNSLIGSLLSSNEFMIQFDDGDPTPWNVSIYENGAGEIAVAVHHAGTEFGECSVGGDRAEIDITGATVGGTQCTELSYLDNVSKPYTINYTDTVEAGDDTINGTYELIVDKETVGPDPDPYFTEGSSEGPYLTEAIYKAEIRVGYNSTRLEYVSETEIIPGETLDD